MLRVDGFNYPVTFATSEVVNCSLPTTGYIGQKDAWLTLQGTILSGTVPILFFAQPSLLGVSPDSFRQQGSNGAYDVLFNATDFDYGGTVNCYFCVLKSVGYFSL